MGLSESVLEGQFEMQRQWPLALGELKDETEQRQAVCLPDSNTVFVVLFMFSFILSTMSRLHIDFCFMEYSILQI